MYMAKKNYGTDFYRDYKPRFSNHEDTEIEVHVATAIKNDVPKRMKYIVRQMTGMVVQGISKEGE